MSDYYDRQGNEIGLLEWGRLHNDITYKRVANDSVNGVEVSTVWLGMDHGFGYSQSPVIFETMIFGGEHDEEMWRYCTEKAALAGHCAVVAALACGADPDGEWPTNWITVGTDD